MYLREHTSRQADPDKFPRFRRDHPEGWPDGIDAIYGLTDNGTTALVSVRFLASKYTPAEARAWLEAQEFAQDVEEAHPNLHGPDVGSSGRVRVYSSGASVRFDSTDAECAIEGVRERREDDEAIEMPATRHDAGAYFRTQGSFTRAGVFSYVRDGKIVREFRPPEEVLSPRSLSTFHLVPLTVGHPPMNLTPATVAAHAVGTVGNPVAVGDVGRADIAIQTQRGLEAYDNGMRWLSAGYDALIVPRRGVYVRADGTEEPFDLVQVEIVGNHVAMTNTPRGGSSLRIDASERLDDVDANRECRPNMAKVKIGQTEFEVPDAAAAAIEQEIAKATTTVAQVTAARDQAQGRADALDRELKKQQEDAQKAQRQDAEVKAVNERAELVALAAPLLEKPIAEVSRMDSKEIMIETLKKADPEFKPEGQTDDYIRGVFDMAVRRRVDSADQIRRAGGGAIFGAPRTDSSDADAKALEAEEAARKKMIEEQSNAWKAKTPA